MSVDDAERWRDLATGRRNRNDRADHFQGRESARRTLAAFLRQPPHSTASNVLLVTGSAGTGKSALLARIVLGLDRAAPFDPGPVDIAMDARNRGLEELRSHLFVQLNCIAGWLDTPPATTSRSMAAAAGSAGRKLGRPVVIVLDGLDQAVDPAAVTEEIVLGLSRIKAGSGAPSVRMVVALRSIHSADRLLIGLIAQVRQLLGEDAIPAELQTWDDEIEADLKSYLVALATAQDPGATGLIELAVRIGDVLSPSFNLAGAAFTALRSWGTGTGTGTGTDEAESEDAVLRACATSLATDIVDVALHESIDPLELAAGLRAAALSLDRGVPVDGVWLLMTAAVTAAEPADPARTANVLIGSRLAGHLILAPGETGLTVQVDPEPMVKLLADHPRLLWTDVEHLASIRSLPLPEPAGLCDPAQQVHWRITTAFVAQLVESGLISPYEPEPDDFGDDGDDFAEYLTAVATDRERDGFDRLQAVRGLQDDGSEHTAATVLSTLAADAELDMNHRCQAAYELWRMNQTGAAIQAYRLLAETCEDDRRQAMLDAVESLIAGDEAPDSIRFPGHQWPRFPPPPGMPMAPRPLSP
jgi:hypothetical protein